MGNGMGKGVKGTDETELREKRVEGKTELEGKKVSKGEKVEGKGM